MDVDQRSDEELGRLVGGGDESAFAELYRRYFDTTYDFALRAARDRNVAALVVQATFLRTHENLRSPEAQASPKVQIFAGARYDVQEQLRRQRQPAPEGEEAFTVADPSRLSQPGPFAELPEMARIAWRAAGELRQDDFDLIDLSARQGLDNTELAAVYRLRPEALESRLARARAELEQSYAAHLLLNRGRRECVDLDFLIGSEEWSASLRRRIVRHLQSCQACQAIRGRYVSGIDAYASLMPVPAPGGWQQIILDRLQEAEAGGAVAMASARSTAQPLPAPAMGGFGDWLDRVFGGGGARGPLLIVFGGGLLIVVTVIGTLCAAGAFDGGGSGSGTVTPTVTVTGTPTTTGTPSLTPTATETFTPPPLPSATELPPTET
ncbi:MAG: sigma-70 family RNA polymerase sigma factor, partial [Chloroflexi bacterium]|nr:sigma-70 family RNA polymerase sigma factor [Chloroflexota bacterium]